MFIFLPVDDRNQSTWYTERKRVQPRKPYLFYKIFSILWNKEVFYDYYILLNTIRE